MSVMAICPHLWTVLGVKSARGEIIGGYLLLIGERRARMSHSQAEVSAKMTDELYGYSRHELC